MTSEKVDIGVSRNDQRDYWESDDIAYNRDPDHPCIRRYARPKIEVIREACAKYAEKDFSEFSALDIGAGNGYLSYHLDQFVETAVAADFSRRMITCNPCSPKLQTLGECMPFPSGSFDLVLCGNFLHHVRNPVRALSEMARVSKLYVVAVEPNMSNLLYYLYAFLVPEDRGTLRFTKPFVRSIFSKTDPALDLFEVRSEGEIVANPTPAWILPVIEKISWLVHPKFFSIYVSRVVENTDD